MEFTMFYIFASVSPVINLIEQSNAAVTRLVDGEDQSKGRAQYWDGSAWGDICDTSFVKNGWPSMICIDIGGFSGVQDARYARNSPSGVGTSPALFKIDGPCTSKTMTSLTECTVEPATKCNHTHDIYIECKDIDECSKENGNCSHTCVNTPGSYHCVCDHGMHLLPDKRTCQDTNGQVGNPAVNRASLDSWSRAMYIPNPDQFIPATTKLLAFEYYARRPATLYLQLFRPVGTLRYKLIASVKHVAYRAGVQTVRLSTPVTAIRGDRIGFYFPAQSVVPFTGSESCNFASRSLYSRPSVVRVGYTYSFAVKQTGWKPCRQYSFKAITNINALGSATLNRPYLDSWSNAMYIPNPDKYFQASAQVIAFTYYARRPAYLYLQVFRPSGYMKYKLIASIRHRATRAGLQTVKMTSPVTVLRGDRIGFAFPAQSVVPFTGTEGCNFATRGLYVRAPRIAVGSVYIFARMNSGWRPCRQYSFKAITVPAPTPVSIGQIIGDLAMQRPSLDSWSNAMYIPNPDKYFTASSRVIGFQYYARRPAYLYLQVFRPAGGMRYKLVASIRHYASRAGVQTVKLTLPQPAMKGDRIGFYFPSQSVVPFTGSEGCSFATRGLYVRAPSIAIGRTYTFGRMLTGWNPCRKYSFRAYATTSPAKLSSFGSAAISRPSLDGWRNAMYIPNPNMYFPAATKVIGFQYYAKRAGLLYLQIFRPVTGTNRYRLIYYIRHYATSAGLKTVKLARSVSVMRGDRIGFWFPSSSAVPFTGVEGCNFATRGVYVQRPTIRLNAIYTFRQMLAGWRPCRQYSFKAITMN